MRRACHLIGLGPFPRLLYMLQRISQLHYLAVPFVLPLFPTLYQPVPRSTPLLPHSYPLYLALTLLFHSLLGSRPSLPRGTLLYLTLLGSTSLYPHIPCSTSRQPISNPSLHHPTCLQTFSTSLYLSLPLSTSRSTSLYLTLHRSTSLSPTVFLAVHAHLGVPEALPLLQFCRFCALVINSVANLQCGQLLPLPLPLPLPLLPFCLLHMRIAFINVINAHQLPRPALSSPTQVDNSIVWGQQRRRH